MRNRLNHLIDEEVAKVGRSRQTTMLDVARIAGVSTSTVSHVVNGTRTVDPTTEQQVRDAIARLGYRPNAVARALATARTMNIGLCLPITANPTFVVLADVIERRLTAAGYHLILHDTRDDIAVQARIIRQLLDLRADGITQMRAAKRRGSVEQGRDGLPCHTLIVECIGFRGYAEAIARLQRYAEGLSAQSVVRLAAIGVHIEP